MNNNKKLTDKEQQELNNFKKWLEAKKYSPKNQDEVKKYYAEYQKEKAQASAQQTKKAAHGTKLNYFKSLKNQCAEDEEVVYFKKGGSVKCGCKKKEDGGEINPKHNPKDPKSRTHIWVPDRTKEPYKKDKVKKDCGGSAIKKFKIAKCGSKLKKHQQGGWIQRGIANPQINITEGVVNPDNKYQWIKRTINANPGGLPNDTVYKAGDKSGFPKDQNSLKNLFNKHYIEDPEWNKKQNMALFLQKIISTKLEGDKLMNGYIPKVK